MTFLLLVSLDIFFFFDSLHPPPALVAIAVTETEDSPKITWRESLPQFPFSRSHRSLAILISHIRLVSYLSLCGEFIISASLGNDIIVWQNPDLKQFTKFGHGDGFVKALVTVGNKVFTAHQDSRIRIGGFKRYKILCEVKAYKTAAMRGGGGGASSVAVAMVIKGGGAVGGGGDEGWGRKKKKKNGRRKSSLEEEEEKRWKKKKFMAKEEEFWRKNNKRMAEGEEVRRKRKRKRKKNGGGRKRKKNK
ncbi:hypothetical protein LguiA_020099 [Lonicera macranthoides]